MKWSPHLTRFSAAIACIFFVFATAATSNKGMSRDWFIGTWGVMLVAAGVNFVSYLACKERGERLGAFYGFCPIILFIAFLIVYRG